jgi:hypothetical protein
LRQWASSCAELLAEIGHQRVEIDILEWHGNGVIAICTAASTALAGENPVGRPVADPAKRSRSTKLSARYGAIAYLRFQSARRRRRISPGMAGQMRHAHVGQNQKADVVDDQSQTTRSLTGSPADQSVARFEFPLRAGKE